MQDYAPFLTAVDERIDELFDVEHEAEHMELPVIDDPYPEFHRLRHEAPVHRGSLSSLLGFHDPHDSLFHADGAEIFTTFSFDASNKVFVENELFTSEAYWKLGTPHFMGDTILNKVGKDHRSYRDPMQPLFKPSYVQSWWNEKFLAPAADILISHIERNGRSNLFLDLCARMPFYVTSAAFGVPAELALPFRLAMDGAAGGSDMDKRTACKQEAIDILTDIVEQRRREPKDDIVSALLSAERELEDGTKVPYTTAEIVDHTRLVVYAGGGTTWRQMAITLFALLDNPDQLAEVIADRKLLGPAVLESARWHTTDPMFPRGCSRDTVLDGVEIPAGSIIHACVGAANRDESRWEDPDRFDIHRPVQRSLAFVSGPHSCLGQHVARQEMETAISMVLDRLPNLRWDPEQPHPKITGALIGRGPTSLPVVWG